MKTSNENPALPQKKTAPYQTLDAWRGIAALLVVAKHWAEVAVRHDPSLGSKPLYIFSTFGGLGVQIFFVISGYCIANAAAANLSRQQGMKAYLWARGRRIYPTYWAAVALMLLFTLLMSSLASRGMAAGNIFTNFQIAEVFRPAFLANLTLMMIPLGYPPFLIVAWTLSYEVVFYGVVAAALLVAYRVGGSAKERVLLNSLHALTLLTLLGLLIKPEAMRFPFDLWSQFGLGVLAFDVLATRKRTTAAVAGMGIALALCLAFAATRDLSIGFLQQPSRLSFLTAAGFAALLVVLHRWDARLASSPIIKLLGGVGVFSYSLYLTHFITVRIAGVGMQMLHLPPSLHYVVFAVAVGTAVGCGYIFFLIFEKPLLRLRSKNAAVITAGNSAGVTAAVTLSPGSGVISPVGTAAAASSSAGESAA